jgi:hypothetical protein
MMSRPAAFNSVASAVIAIVGDGLTRARRSARKGMISLQEIDVGGALYCAPLVL